MSQAPGELAAALRAGYRVTVHDGHFPFDAFFGPDAGVVHAVVDHGARAIFCSTEWAAKCAKASE